MRKYTIPVFIVLSGLLALKTNAQEKWDLRKCVEYAKANNISVKQADIQKRFADIQYKQSKQGQWPTANFNWNPGYQFGRSIDPTTNSFTNQNIFASGFGLSSSVNVFNFFSKKNTIEANALDSKATEAQIEKIRNDISLNVATAYLQALLNKESANIAAVQIQQSTAQLSNTRKLVDAGSLPELNAAELEAQLARDSATYITSYNNYQISLLQLKALLNLDAATPFDIETPPIESIPVDPIAELQPELVYNMALQNQPLQKVNAIKGDALKKRLEATKGQLYPSIGVSASLQSNWLGNPQARGVGVPMPVYPTIGDVNVGGVGYKVTSSYPVNTYSSYAKPNMFTQIGDNFRQAIGLGINVPIFNGGSARANIERSKLDIASNDLQIEKDNMQLKQDIYNAYVSAAGALQKYNANVKSLETAQKSYTYASKRYDLGLLQSIDLITNQNNLFRAKLDVVNSKTEYVFRMKVLEFYKGLGIKL